MPNLEKKNDIEKKSEKKSYRQPRLKEIGKVTGITKGGSWTFNFDSVTYMPGQS